MRWIDNLKLIEGNWIQIAGNRKRWKVKEDMGKVNIFNVENSHFFLRTICSRIILIQFSSLSLLFLIKRSSDPNKR